MKKRYSTCAGILAALILAGMFIAICLSSTPLPFLPPATTIDPITDANIDPYSMMVLTGTTTLPDTTYNISLVVSPSPGSLSAAGSSGKSVIRTYPIIHPERNGRNRWKGVLDIAGLQNGSYTVAFVPFLQKENFSRTDQSPLATASFTLGNGDGTPGTLRKKTPVTIPFIRINPSGTTGPSGPSRISGTTNLKPGTPLAWDLQPLLNGTAPAYPGTMVVTPGTGGVNRWEIVPGNRTPAPGRYRVHVVTAGAPPGSGPVSADEEIDLTHVMETPSPIQENPAGFLTIDAVPETRTNSVSVITGTTSLSPGGALFVEIVPASFETNFNFSLDARETSENRTLSGAVVFAGTNGFCTIVPAGSGMNLWSFRLESYHLDPGVYQITVSNNDYDYAINEVVQGNLSVTRVFTIRGERP